MPSPAVCCLQKHGECAFHVCISAFSLSFQASSPRAGPGEDAVLHTVLMRKLPGMLHWPGPLTPPPRAAYGMEGSSGVDQGGLISLEDFHFIREGVPTVFQH